MSIEQLIDLTQPQRDRLAFIELRVRFIGEIRRNDLVLRFGIQSAAATRDLALYKELAPNNIDYDSKGKSYEAGAMAACPSLLVKSLAPDGQGRCSSGSSKLRLTRNRRERANERVPKKTHALRGLYPQVQ
jgi:hypothetical protein